jgi:hypothetical protein
MVLQQIDEAEQINLYKANPDAMGEILIFD